MTTSELIEMLKVHPGNTRVVIEDADTNWYSDKITVTVEGANVILSIDYPDMATSLEDL